jgi:hypothetical protein
MGCIANASHLEKTLEKRLVRMNTQASHQEMT